MENIVYDDYVYSNLFKNGNYILKYSSQGVSAWTSLSKKDLPFLNLPLAYFELSESEKIKYPNSSSKIYLPYLNGFYTLYGNNNSIDAKDILLLFKKMLQLAKKMHSDNVYHGDMHSMNIMINNNLDISFIDLDASIVDDIISDENVYFEDLIPLEDKKLMTMADDKLGIFNLLLYYFVNGNFNASVDYYIDFRKLKLSKSLCKEVMSYSEGNGPSQNYYFLDIIDELIKMGYESCNKSK